MKGLDPWPLLWLKSSTTNNQQQKLSFVSVSVLKMNVQCWGFISALVIGQMFRHNQTDAV